MTKDNKFLLLSLNEKESKSVAQILSNDTARKILDHLTEKQEASASEMSKELNIPLPTMDYNLKQLVKAKLVESKEFVWSSRGKEISIYRLAKKLVIIAPKSTSLKEIKSLLPIAIITAITAFILKVFQQSSRTIAGAKVAISEAAAQSADSASSMIVESTSIVTNPAWLWFSYGAIFVIILFLIFTIVRSMKK